MGAAIAITGIGVISAIGLNAEQTLQSLRQKRSGIAAPKYLSTSHVELPVGEVPLSDEELNRLLLLPEDEEISRTTLLGAVAARQAYGSAGLTPFDVRDERMAFISGTTVAGMDLTERHFHEMLADGVAASKILSHDCESNTLEIARLSGLEGCHPATVSTACSSALNAIIMGVKMLLAGEAERVVAGGSEALSRFHLNGFNSLMILDKEQCRPFDTTRQGLNLGEGAAYVVLERVEHAQKRGVKPLAYIGGYGNRCDAYHQTATSPTGEGAYLAMTDALACADTSPLEIDYINAHGTGTPDNDRSESTAMRRVFGDRLPPVSSTKSFTGHTTSASGSIELVITLLAMRHGFVPASLGFGSADADCVTPSSGEDRAVIHKALCNSFGFGGNDSSLLITDEPVALAEPDHSVPFHIAAMHRVTTVDKLAELRQYVSPMESRRMSTLLKAALLTSMKALEKAEITRPDAIIIATRYGMLEQGEKILQHLDQNGEEGLSPTLFMQSTHNTIAGTLAIRLGCHGYNLTVSSLQEAQREARRLLEEGRATTVLIGHHDFYPPIFRVIMERARGGSLPELTSTAVVVTSKVAEKSPNNSYFCASLFLGWPSKAGPP
ncbi:MAG: beta-ketoacyl-[acyl-carrier-protein] synthase family protein [Bacteroidales bacterium]|nr:beta-ketoacyl-[acyl-carrier-protein] synthase family protein [Bacteroidales bacterium]